jgi:hypothetical protein
MADEPPVVPERVDRRIFLTQAKLRVTIVTSDADPWVCIVTQIPAEAAEPGDETLRNQAELWRVYIALKLKPERNLLGWAASVLAMPLDRLLIRRYAVEEMRRIDAPKPPDYPGLRGDQE